MDSTGFNDLQPGRPCTRWKSQVRFLPRPLLPPPLVAGLKASSSLLRAQTSGVGARHCTKTQGSFSTEAAAVTLLWGLIAFGQIRMRRIDGYQHLYTIIDHQEEAAA